MKRPPKFLAVCATIVIAPYVAYTVILPTVYLRYRLTLEVDVDGITRTGFPGWWRSPTNRCRTGS